ncbi:purine nucleoside phosphorylase [Trichuris trichiura]|uniref:purine-nucleoside phosphorylase n=1 Tax=Trichuris trichiura TaxID=36087 RepID=A0A077Z5A4_TRITR|nr:purine nucleoside phosphorylase [Trichuris trichiura]
MDEIMIKKAVSFLKDDMRVTPSVGIVCGTGKDDLSDHMKLCRSLKYNEIPGFPCPRGYGHPGSLIHGYLGHKYVVGIETRLRSFDGYKLSLCVTPIIIMQKLGIRTVFLTTMAGKLSDHYEIGDIMLVKDHIYIPGIFGKGIGMEEKRNAPVSGRLYKEKLRDLFQIAARQVEPRPPIHEGIYAMINGPACATETELNFLRSLKADAVGMGICHDAVTAYNCGMDVIAAAVLGDEYGKYLQKRVDYDTYQKLKQSSRDLLCIGEKFINLL